MAVDDEMAWEPRLPLHSLRRPILAKRPSTPPVPERFEIVVADILAGLTFDCVLGPTPRTAQRARRPRHDGSMIFDPVSHLAPVVWEPELPSGMRRLKSQHRTHRHQESREPAPQGVIAAQRMTWMPHLPNIRNRVRARRSRDVGGTWRLEMSVLATGVQCTELEDRALTSPAFLADGLTTSTFLGETLTSPAFLDEEFC